MYVIPTSTSQAVSRAGPTSPVLAILESAGYAAANLARAHEVGE
jgi:hypothetical protein